MKRKRTYTQKRTYVRRIKRGRTRGKGLPYVYNNKVYLGKKTTKRFRSNFKNFIKINTNSRTRVSELIAI